MKIVVATTNSHKFEEIRRIAPEGFELVKLEQTLEIEEHGRTFLENAIIKAREVGELLKSPVIADDSGLVIEALNGFPGVQSARFMEGEPYSRRMEKILEMLQGEQNRNAHFHCAAVFYDPKSSVLMAFEGVVKGRIADRIHGSGGFGYDPIFIPLHQTRTFGELPSSLKNKISHRARAFRGLFHLIEVLVRSKYGQQVLDRSG